MLRDPVVLESRSEAGRGVGEEVIARQRLHVWIRGVQSIIWSTHSPISARGHVPSPLNLCPSTLSG